MQKSRKTPPRYQIILEDLTAQIQSGAFSFGEPLCTEASLAEAYQASRVTVRHALQILEERGLIDRRRGIGCFVRSSGYNALPADPIAAPAHLQPIFAFVFPRAMGLSAIRSVFVSACSELILSDLHAAVYLTGESPGECPSAVLSRLADMDFAGVVLCLPHPDEVFAQLDLLRMQEKSIVLLEPGETHLTFPTVCTDREQSAVLLAKRLLAQGIRRFFCCSGQAGPDALCFHSFVQALFQNGIPPASIHTVSVDEQPFSESFLAEKTAVLADSPDTIRILVEASALQSCTLCCLAPCTAVSRPVLSPLTDFSALGKEAVRCLLQPDTPLRRIPPLLSDEPFADAPVRR